MTLRQSDATKFTLADGSTAVAGLQKWTLRCTGGRYSDRLQPYRLHPLCDCHGLPLCDRQHRRRREIHDPRVEHRPRQSVRSRVIGCRTIQLGGAKIVARHCEFEGYSNTGFLVDATATVAPEIGNCVFSGITQTPITNNSSNVTLTTANCYGNAFLLPVSAGIP